MRHFYPRSPCGERPMQRTCTVTSMYFYPRSPCGERRTGYRTLPYWFYFYPRSPCGERHQARCIIKHKRDISIHALLAESDIIRQHSEPDSGNFYPRSPCGERPFVTTTTTCIVLFLSTLSLRRATHQANLQQNQHRRFLSTLSLRRATDATLHCLRVMRISIHALLAESDRNEKVKYAGACLFLSTLSLRRATAKVHKTVEHFCTYETNFMGIASSY